MVGWAGASLGFSLGVPRKEHAGAVGTPPQRSPGLWRPQPRWLLAHLKTMTEPCAVGDPAAVPFLRLSGARR